MCIRDRSHTERITLFATNLGDLPVVLGLPWLTLHNPKIDWRTQRLEFDRCPAECRNVTPDPEPLKARATEMSLLEPRLDADGLEVGDHIFAVRMEDDPMFARASSTMSTRLAEAAAKDKAVS